LLETVRTSASDGVRIHAGERILKTALFRFPLPNILASRLTRKCQHIKWLATFCGAHTSLPNGVREWETEESPFLRGFPPFEQLVRAVGEVAVRPIRLLDEQDAAGLLLSEEGEHLAEPVAAGLFGGLDVDELLEKSHIPTRGVAAKRFQSL